jgi:lipopolysaccharide export system protein LptA
LFLLSPAILVAQAPSTASVIPKKIPAIALLPDGSQLKGVMLPRYDEHHKLVAVLKAATMMLVNSEQIDVNTATVEFFNPDQSSRGRANFKTASFFQTKGLLLANEPVDLTADRLNAHGTALYYLIDEGEGFLSGPVTTVIHPLPATTMNTPLAPLRATVLLGMSLLAQSLIAAPPPALTTEEKAEMKSDPVSHAAAVREGAAATREDLKTSIAASQAADQAAQAFLVQANIPVPAASQPTAVPAPLDVKPGPDDTVVKCEGGAYFDSDEGLMVYMKNVTVTDPRLDLWGANELKVFMVKKPADAPKIDKSAPPQNGFGEVGANFDGVDRLVATGAVRVLQKSQEPGKPPVEASGAILTYHVKTGETVISGGYPWVKQGDKFMRAKEPNLILRIQKSGSFVTEGNWEMGGKLNQKN